MTTKLLKDIITLGAGQGTFTALDFGMDESDWKTTEGGCNGYVVGWWAGEPGELDFPATTSDEAAWVTAGRVAITDTEGNRREFVAGEGYLLPKGFAGRWETLEAAQKLYVIFS